MVTAKQIQREFGLTRRTLTKYTALGLLPAPLRLRSGRERGVVVVWPDGIRDLLGNIIRLQQEGKALDDIPKVATRLGAHDVGQQQVDWTVRLPDWPSPSRIWSFRLRAYLDADEPSEDGSLLQIRRDQHGPPPTALEVFRWHVWRACHDVVQNEEVSQRVTDATTTHHVINEAVQLFRNGYSPVLVWTGSRVYVTTDFLVAHEMSPVDASMLAASHNEPDLLARAVSQIGRLVLPVTEALLDASVFSVTPFAAPNFLTLIPRRLSFLDQEALVAFDFNYVLTLKADGSQLDFSLVPQTGRVSAIGNLTEGDILPSEALKNIRSGSRGGATKAVKRRRGRSK